MRRGIGFAYNHKKTSPPDSPEEILCTRQSDAHVSDIQTGDLGVSANL